MHKFFATTKNSRPRCQNCRAVFCPLRPANSRFRIEGERKGHDGLYSIHVAPWHAPHALTRAYTTVLHLHTSVLSESFGPRYSCPDKRGVTVNAAGNETAVLVGAREILTTVIACGLQVCCDFTRTLVERVVCLDKTIVVKGTPAGNIKVSYPAPRSRVGAIHGTNLSNHRARGEQQGCECAEDRHLKEKERGETRKNSSTPTSEAFCDFKNPAS